MVKINFSRRLRSWLASDTDYPEVVSQGDTQKEAAEKLTPAIHEAVSSGRVDFRRRQEIANLDDMGIILGR